MGFGNDPATAGRRRDPSQRSAPTRFFNSLLGYVGQVGARLGLFTRFNGGRLIVSRTGCAIREPASAKPAARQALAYYLIASHFPRAPSLVQLRFFEI